MYELLKLCYIHCLLQFLHYYVQNGVQNDCQMKCKYLAKISDFEVEHMWK